MTGAITDNIITVSRLLQSANAWIPIDVTEAGMVTDVKPDRPSHKLLGITLTLSPKVKSVIFVQFPNAHRALYPAAIQLSALNVTVDRPLQPEKTELPKDVTELPIIIEVKPLQLENAQPPILVTELGMVTDVRLLQLQKANSSIDVTESPMVNEVRLLQL